MRENLVSSQHDCSECLGQRKLRVTHTHTRTRTHAKNIVQHIQGVHLSSLSGKRKWKKTCCVPSFILFVLVLLCLFAGLGLLAIVNVDGENRTMNGVLIAMGSVVGMAMLVNCKTWWQVMDSVLNSQRKRLHSAANRMHKLKSEGFMKVKH